MVSIQNTLVHPGLVFSHLLVDILVGSFVFLLVKYAFGITAILLENRRLNKLIPSPPSSWIYGHWEKFTRDQDGLLRQVESIKDYPAMFYLYYAPFSAVVTTYHPDIAKLILTSDTHKPILFKRFLKKIVGESLFSTDGQRWKTQRHMLNPAFHAEILKLHIDVFNETVKTTLEWLNEKSEFHEPCDIAPVCSRLSFDIMTRCVLSQPGAQNGEDVRLIQNMKEIQRIILKRFMNPFFHSDFLFNLSSSSKKFQSLVSENDAKVREIIQNRKCKQNELNPFEQKAGLEKQKRKIDLLDVLLRSKYEDGSGLSESEIFDQVRLFFVAGSETTGNAMTWLSYALSINQDWQDKCREEIMEVCGDKDLITWDDISKLKVLHLCIKETLRLYPVAPFIGRTVHSPLTLVDPYDKKKVINLRKGTHINICVFALHRHPEFWENPDVFDPERFTPERSKNRPFYAYIPFSASLRNCIGQNFAMFEMKVSFAHILRKYKLLPAPELPPPYMASNVTLAPKDHVFVKVEKL